MTSPPGSTAEPLGPPVEGFDVDAPWRLHPAVSIRPERFGAMAYHFDTRRLSFLKSRPLLEVARSLEHHASARVACGAAGLGPAELPAYEAALRRLAETDMIVRRSTAAGPGRPEPSWDVPVPPAVATGRSLVEEFQFGLAAPICLTWELTYACNLACAHCLSSSGRRDPGELDTAECRAVVDELERMGVFYVNIGGGEPTIRSDFWDLLDYATAHHVGVKFSTNGTRITSAVAERLARSDYVDVQISLDGATAAVNDAVRGEGSYAAARRAMARLAEAGFRGFKLSVVATRHNISELDDLEALAAEHGAQLRITRLRPSGRGADVWDELHPTAEQQRLLYDWLRARDEQVLTGDSFFHLAGFGEPLPGLNLCGAGRVVCLIDPVGDVYACPFAIHDRFRAGNVRGRGGFAAVWAESELFADLRRPQSGGACQTCSAFDGCRGGCPAAKFFTGLPLEGPDPECVRGHGTAALSAERVVPRPSADHSRPGVAVPVVFGAPRTAPTPRPCATSPLAGFSVPTAR